MFQGLLPGSQGHNLAVTLLHVPNSLDSGWGKHVWSETRLKWYFLWCWDLPSGGAKRPRGNPVPSVLLSREWGCLEMQPRVDSGDTTPCRMTGVTLHGAVSPEDIPLSWPWENLLQAFGGPERPERL